MNPQNLKTIVSSGLLSFPVTDFDEQGDGAKIVGHDAGPVRPPLTDLKPNEMEELAALIKTLGPQ